MGAAGGVRAAAGPAPRSARRHPAAISAEGLRDLRRQPAPRLRGLNPNPSPGPVGPALGCSLCPEPVVSRASGLCLLPGAPSTPTCPSLMSATGSDWS